jgi:hypothetical protein
LRNRSMPNPNLCWGSLPRTRRSVCPIWHNCVKLGRHRRKKPSIGGLCIAVDDNTIPQRISCRTRSKGGGVRGVGMGASVAPFDDENARNCPRMANHLGLERVGHFG